MDSNTIYYFECQTLNLSLQTAQNISKLTIQLLWCSNTKPYKTLSNPIYQRTYLEHILHLVSPHVTYPPFRHITLWLYLCLSKVNIWRGLWYLHRFCSIVIIPNYHLYIFFIWPFVHWNLSFLDLLIGRHKIGINMTSCRVYTTIGDSSTPSK